MARFQSRDHTLALADLHVGGHGIKRRHMQLLDRVQSSLCLVADV
jgi:hypothetical protein